MGHRIELGEIETAVSSVKGVESNCCIYDQQSSRIIMYYTGTADGKYVMERLKEMLPVYMLPNKRIHLEEMPFNLNGKIDRQRLKEMGRGINDGDSNCSFHRTVADCGKRNVVCLAEKRTWRGTGG